MSVETLAGLQSKVPGWVGSTRFHTPFCSCTSTWQLDPRWPLMSVAPMMPLAVNGCSSLLSTLNSDARSSVWPLATTLFTASWNSRAMM